MTPESAGLPVADMRGVQVLRDSRFRHRASETVGIILQRRLFHARKFHVCIDLAGDHFLLVCHGHA